MILNEVYLYIPEVMIRINVIHCGLSKDYNGGDRRNISISDVSLLRIYRDFSFVVTYGSDVVAKSCVERICSRTHVAHNIYYKGYAFVRDPHSGINVHQR